MTKPPRLNLKNKLLLLFNENRYKKTAKKKLKKEITIAARPEIKNLLSICSNKNKITSNNK